MRKYKLFVLGFFNVLGTPNYYQGVQKVSFYEKYYKFRIGFKTAYKVSKIIHL